MKNIYRVSSSAVWTEVRTDLEESGNVSRFSQRKRGILAKSDLVEAPSAELAIEKLRSAYAKTGLELKEVWSVNHVGKLVE